MDTFEKDKKEIFDAIDSIVKWSKERGFPPGDWSKLLQDALTGTDALALGVKFLPVPLAVYDRTGKLVLANDLMLENLGMTAEHIEKRIPDVYDLDMTEFRNAAKLALQGETTIVRGVRLPFGSMGTGMSNDFPKTQTAILFPVADDRLTTLRGAVMFLPFDYNPAGDPPVSGGRA